MGNRFLGVCLSAVALAVTLAVALIGCGSKAENAIESGADLARADQIQAVATVGMVAELVRNVGGDHVAVKQICGSGVDPHGYLPTRDDVQDITQADIVFYCGLMLEGKMAGKLEMAGKRQTVIAVTDAIDHSMLLSGDSSVGSKNAESHGDPHVWNDVSIWSQCADLVRDELIKQRPEYRDAFTANASAFREKLAKLHEYGIASLATVPKESRLLVTSHDAFSYFGRAYDLDVQGIQGISTESKAGLLEINQLVDLLIKRKVKAVFVESSVSPKNVDALIEGAASKGHTVIKGGMLFSDAMGAEGTYEGTYLGMLDHNLTTATRALGGQADAGGFQGKLSGVQQH